MKLLQNSTLKIVITFMALFFTSHAFAGIQEAPQTENQKIEYMVKGLIPNNSLYTSTYALPFWRAMVPFIATLIVKDKYNAKNHKIKQREPFPWLSIIAVNILDILTSAAIQTTLIPDENFRSPNSTAYGFFPSSLLYALIHKLWYNQLRFLKKTLDTFEDYPEKFPLIAHPLLNKTINEYDTLDSKEKMKIYTELMLIAKPLLETKEQMNKILEQINSTWSDTQKRDGLKKEYDQLAASIA